ncbi:MAG: arylsulfatase [Planctomycetota bacterium]
MKSLIPLVLLSVCLHAHCNAATDLNLVFILCDDLGYGDVQCLAPATSRIPTPHADQLAADGMVFTNAHSGSSVCTPTRYGIMTGRYSWRTRLQAGVVTGYAPSLIAAGRPTVASFLQNQGFHTAAIGKWHLDFEYLDQESGRRLTAKEHPMPPVGAIIPDGPLTRGFDFYHGFHHARNMEAVIENDRVIEHDQTVNMLPRLTQQAVSYIDSRQGADEPFFLYLALGSPHTPIVPSKDWQGKSGLGDYGDFVMQTDHALGEVCKALDRNGMRENTLVVFTSDNGCSKAAGIGKLAKQGHSVSAHFRGSKADIWDGGHNIPFIVRWPAKVASGSQTNQLICLADWFATVAELTSRAVPAGSCEDSVSFAGLLTGDPVSSGRQVVIHHSVSGHFAIRRGSWKLILARGSGGWTSPKENEVPAGSPEGQLYDLSVDPGETNSLFESKPELVADMLEDLRRQVQQGRTTEGEASSNDVDNVVLWKSQKKRQRKKAVANP